MATKADLEQLFREADVDGSNSLTLAELCSAMKRLGYKGDDAVIKAYFAKADASGDNKVSFDEYMKSMSSVPPQLHRAALMRRIFAKFDTDGNGTLNRKELQKATALLGDRFSDEDVEVLMEILDKDHSDTIDMEEFIQAFMNKRRA
jgi:Ca2+-binding EF-hand superfamily protein